MKTKTLIIGAIILEIIFLSWTSFLEKPIYGGGQIDTENTITSVPLAVIEKNQNDTLLNVIVEQIYDVSSNYLDFQNRDLTAILMLPLKDENETYNVANSLNEVIDVDASNNYLSELPIYFLKMNNLKNVFLGNTNIKYISSNGRSESIETLDLSNNELSSFSTTTLSLPNLQYLNLSGNYNLKRLSIEKGDFSNLKELNIKYTKLAENSERIAEFYELLPSDVEIFY
jgi:Leucine-rich repeat (LRR) protein